MARLSSRRVCPNCNANYHLINMPPKTEGVCDKCGTELIQRKDDNPETIKKRWEVFMQETNKVLDFYKEKDKLVSVDGRGNADQVFERVNAKLA